MTVATERLVTSMIVLNLPVAAWAEITHDELAERIDSAILAFFACEIALRIAFAIRRRSFDRWLVVDGMIVALAALPIGFPVVIRAARLAYLGRHGMHLRHVTIARGVQFVHA
jgi:uncharacterized RDD family membrane protein YckC